jgi:predicted extracellular nuclease
MCGIRKPFSGEEVFMRKFLPPAPQRQRRIMIGAAALIVFAVIIQQLYFARPVSAAISVFINEIHYDNTGTDAGEAIEIAGPAGTNLSGWSLVLYNGADRLSYNTLALSGTIPNQQSGFGTLHFNYAVNGIQNGSPDGIALVNGGVVVQFLSYEGAFTALNGPASGMLSTDIGVSENGSEPVGQSLRLSGTGQLYEDFTWNAPATATFGAINTGQNFGAADAAPSVLNTSPANGASNIAVDTNISITFSESVNATATAFTIECPAGTAKTFTQSASPATTFTLDPTADLPFSTTCTVTVNAGQITDADPNDPPNNMAANFVFSFTVAAAPPVVANNVIINELDSDTPGADSGEFVELYDGGVGNTSLNGLIVVFYNGSNDLSYRTIDLNGRTTNAAGYFTLGNAAVPGVDLTFPNDTLQNGADAVALYAASAATFPNNTPITTANLRDAVVYGTNDPADPGLLVLLNAGQPQVDESATGDSTTASIGRCPNGDGGARNTCPYATQTPTPDGANNCPAAPVAAAIHDIQGSGTASPFAGQGVIASGIVTGRKSNGFFMQDPVPDADPNTSEGIFVFVGGTPAVAVGDAVTVTGTATEFFNLTQIASSSCKISISSSGNPLPAATTLTTTILNPAGATDQLEPLEGMRVHADSLVSVAPTNEFGEIFTVLEGVARPMREPGIEISLPVPPDPTTGVPDCCIPRWDENPERIAIDSDGLIGSTVISVTSNVTISNVSGPLDFTFSDYKVLPEAAPTTSANMSAVPVPTPAPGEFTVAGFNIENFNNNLTQRKKAALAIRDVLRLPDIIGTIEIFDLDDLEALADEIELISGVHYETRLVEADGLTNDADQDVGFLVKTSRVQIDSVIQEELAGCDGTAANCNTFIDPNTNQPALLNDRPPLVLRATVDALTPNPRQVLVVVNHLRSFIDIELVTGEGPRVRAKRKAQSEFLAELLQDLQTGNPGTPVLSIGDYNAYQFNDGYTDPVATIKGTPTADDQMVVDASLDLVNPDFTNLTDSLMPADQRYSFIFEGTPQAIDHFIINTAAAAILQRYHIARNNADFPEGPLFAGDATRPERNSDHDMAVGYFKFPKATTTTAVSNVTAVYSPSDQNVTLTANVSGPATVTEGTVTFTVRNAANAVVGTPVVGNVSAGVATANYILPGGTTPQALTITGDFSGGDFTLPSSGTGTLSVTFNICVLYDQTKAVKSGAVYPIKIQLCDINGNNVSSADTVVTAVNVQQVSSSSDGDVITSGNANPDSNFRFDNGSYIINLKTTGLSTGVYKLYFTAGNDPVQHSVEFQVK